MVHSLETVLARLLISAHEQFYNRKILLLPVMLTVFIIRLLFKFGVLFINFVS